MSDTKKESTNGGSISVVGGMFTKTEKELELPPKTAMKINSLSEIEDCVVIPLVPNREQEFEETTKE